MIAWRLACIGQQAWVRQATHATGHNADGLEEYRLHRGHESRELSLLADIQADLSSPDALGAGLAGA